MARCGGDLLLEVLESEGIRHVFGNPGTTELPLMDALVGRSSLRYVLALQEATAVGMADGFSLASGRPSFVNLHAAAGLGNGIGNLVNVRANGSPVVVTAGQQDRRHLHHDPLLSGDLVSMAEPLTKWARQVESVEELAVVLRRALNDVLSPPTGPVFLSLPSDLLDEPTEEAVPAASTLRRAAVSEGVQELADLLEAYAPGELAIIAGDENAHVDGVPSLVAVAEQLEAPVWGAPLYGVTVFPARHRLWQGALPSNASAINQVLGRYKAVFVVGGQVLKVYPWTPGPALPEHVALIHLSPDPAELGRAWPCLLGVAGHPRATLDRLSTILRTAGRHQDTGEATPSTALQDRHREIETRYAALPMDPDVAVHAVLRALPQNVAVVNEAVTTGLAVRDLHAATIPGRYFFARGGGLGWGMPASVGVSLALDSEPVVCFVGDGSALYSPQAMWTAARERLPIVYVVVNNGGYRILKDALVARGRASAQQQRYIGMDLNDPQPDHQALAASMGVPSHRIERASDVSAAVEAVLLSGGPGLIELPIAAP